MVSPDTLPSVAINRPTFWRGVFFRAPFVLFPTVSFFRLRASVLNVFLYARFPATAETTAAATFSQVVRIHRARARVSYILILLLRDDGRTPNNIVFSATRPNDNRYCRSRVAVVTNKTQIIQSFYYRCPACFCDSPQCDDDCGCISGGKKYYYDRVFTNNSSAERQINNGKIRRR